ncbi:MAG TPA: thiamine pyrophosphate-binding protein [Roseiflexaceae bacterium]|nr:thiamine pyrophosphate-binding protein [Roseiflexaceae bacterium]
MHGGDIAAEALLEHGVRFVFTLAGGHIAPVLVGCKRRGIRVVDTRHEATAVFAADAVARLSGVPGVAVVTAGPGVTNTLTAVKNAQLAQSPVVLLGGAAPTVLRGRGALQDIDQVALLRAATKWQRTVARVRDIAPALAEAFRRAREGVPGPVFVELPADVLYPEAVVREWYGLKSGGRTLTDRALQRYLAFHLGRLFGGLDTARAAPPVVDAPPAPDQGRVRAVVRRLLAAERPLLLVGSQALLDPPAAQEVAVALGRVGAPVYLSGMARGLLGANHPLQLRHHRREALRAADMVLLAGVPCDFRLDYGRHIPRRATVVSANRSRTDMTRNRRPTIGVPGDPGLFLRMLAAELPPGTRWGAWLAALRARDDAREEQIRRAGLQPSGAVNPLHLCREIAAVAGPNSVFVVDGGDFVATASYILRPPAPLSWLDPGPFGTLGVGAGFALGAKLCRPEAEVWLLYGDGSAGYSLAEFDTFTRHGLPLVAVVGNDAGWTQIAREQVKMLGDDVGTALAHSDYHAVAEGFGGAGFRLDDPELAGDVLAQARQAAATGRPALVNAILGKTGFREGSIAL